MCPILHQTWYIPILVSFFQQSVWPWLPLCVVQPPQAPDGEVDTGLLFTLILPHFRASPVLTPHVCQDWLHCRKCSASQWYSGTAHYSCQRQVHLPLQKVLLVATLLITSLIALVKLRGLVKTETEAELLFLIGEPLIHSL